MDVDVFYARIDELTSRLARLRGNGAAGANGAEQHCDNESAAALDETLEGLRVAGEEVRQQDENLLDAVMALESERQVNRDLFDLTPEAHVVTDPMGMIRAANHAAELRLGRPNRSIVGMPLPNRVIEPERRAFRSLLNQLLVDGSASGLPFHFQRMEGGEPFEAELSATVVHDRARRPAQVYWLIRDVSNRRRAEAAERQAWLDQAETAEAELARYRDLLEEIDAIIWDADPDTGRLLYINRRAEDMLGYPLARWYDDPTLWTGLIHPDDREWVLEQRRRARRLDRDQELEYRLIAADGRVIWFREVVRPLRDAQGRVASLRGTLWNISRRKKVERQLYVNKREMAANLADLAFLRELGSRLAAHAELAPLLAELLDGVLAVLGAETGIVRLYDPRRDELAVAVSRGLSEAYLARFGRVQPGAEACGLTAARGEPTVVEDVETDPDYAPSRPAARLGGFRAAYSAPLLNRSGELLGTVAACFAERHRPPERQVHLVGLFARQAADLVQNARLLQEVRAADRAKEDFLALLAHELRNPLATVLNTAHALDPDRATPADLAEARAVLTRQAAHMGRLIGELLDAARSRHGVLALHRRTVDLVDVVTPALEAMRGQVEGRRHALAVHVPDEPVWLEADPDRLRQLVENLVGNAARYTNPGGRIDLTVEADAHEARLRVRDNGIGIAPEVLPRIFDLYAQAYPSPARADAGLGLGLAFAKTIAEGHGGQIVAESAGLGRGCTFTVFLPRGDVRAPAPAPAPAADAPTRALRLLVVDDNADAARGLSRLLSRWGHEVRIAADGPEALALAPAFRPEIALVDIGMPGMDGYEVARRLAQDGQGNCTLIALTGYGWDEDRRRTRAAGFAYHLVKPAEPDELRRLIAQVGRSRGEE